MNISPGHQDLDRQPPMHGPQDRETPERWAELDRRFRWPLGVAAVLGFVLLATGSGVIGWTLGNALTGLRPIVQASTRGEQKRPTQPSESRTQESLP